VAGEWMARAAWPGRVAGREALPPRRCFVSGPEYHDVSLVGVGLPPVLTWRSVIVSRKTLILTRRIERSG
jgi:hypothetical protein